MRKRSLPNAKSSPAKVRAFVDRAESTLWKQHLARLLEAEQRGASAWDELWETAGAIVDHDPPLYILGGYASASAFFEAVLHERERTARRYIRVARFASPKEEARYGVALLDAAIGYLEAKLGHATDSLPVAFDRLKIPVTKGKTTVLVPLAKATVSQVNAAARKVALRKHPVRASAAHRAIADAFATDEALAEVHVHERDGLASFTHVPVAKLQRFGKTLLAIELPDVGLRRPKA